MKPRPILSTARAGLWSAITAFLLGLSYLVVLALGLHARGTPADPVPDPWFSVLELLIIAMMPAMILLMASVHRRARPEAQLLTLSALAFMTVTAAVTSCVHFAVLVLSRQPAFVRLPAADLLIGFRWPSLAYLLDIVAWDLFFALSMLLAAPAFCGAGLERAIRLAMRASGVLALAGLAGVAAGDMHLRDIGIVGYGPGWLLVVGLLVTLYWRERPAEIAAG